MSKVTHDSFTIERTLDASPERVYAPEGQNDGRLAGTQALIDQLVAVVTS